MALDDTARDAIERLETVNPVPPGAIADFDGTPFALALRRSIVQLPRPRRPWWRRVVLPIIIVVAVGAGWTCYSVFERPVTYGSVDLCYEAPNLGARVFLATGPRDSAVATCADIWRAGRFGAKKQPALVECVGRVGEAEVFPSSDPTLCARLNLATPSGGENAISKVGAASDTLEHEIVATIQSSRCLTPTALSSAVRHDFHTLGLDNWHVDIGAHFGGAYPCAGASVRDAAHTVDIEPEAPR